MTACGHTRIEACDEHDDDMHCVGWIWADCGQRGIGECHHLSWCRHDFCGEEPLRGESAALSIVEG